MFICVCVIYKKHKNCTCFVDTYFTIKIKLYIFLCMCNLQEI